MAADEGSAEAQAALGDAYDHGVGVDRDDEEAFRFYQLAAEQGFPRAIGWIALAAQQGYGPALIEFGAMRWAGRWVERDERHAAELLHAAGIDYLVTLTWADNSPDDLDLYVMAPRGEIAWYHERDAGVVQLLKDDRGAYRDESLVNEELAGIQGSIGENTWSTWLTISLRAESLKR